MWFTHAILELGKLSKMIELHCSEKDSLCCRVETLFPKTRNRHWNWLWRTWVQFTTVWYRPKWLTWDRLAIVVWSEKSVQQIWDHPWVLETDSVFPHTVLPCRLRCCYFSQVGGEFLSTALLDNKSLIHLDLGSNSLQDSGLRFLCHVLQQSTCTLQELE